MRKKKTVKIAGDSIIYFVMIKYEKMIHLHGKKK